MEQFFGSGRAIDLVIAVLVIEALLLRGMLARHRVLPTPTLLAGLALLVAWRAAQSGAPWFWVAAALTAAGAAHAWDVWQRWPKR
jgi:O-antigen ligase